MQAWVLNSKKAAGIALVELPKPRPRDDEVRIRLHAAALNRRDLWCCEGKYPHLKEGCIIGSDGAGVVETCGAHVDASWQKESVVINPNIDWGKQPKVQGQAYEIRGMPSAGTFAEYICVPAHRLRKKPFHLSMEQAAALPLAGLTAYRALRRQADLRVNQKLLITGIGGGVANMLLKLALDMGAEVWVSSSATKKITRAKQIGAQGGFLYTKKDWGTIAQKQVGDFDAVIDGTGGEAINTYLQILRPAGRLIIYGATCGPPKELDLRRLFWKQIRIQGSTMGNDEEFAHMLRLTESHRLIPCIDRVFELKDAPKALNRLRNTQQMGKIVLRCHT